MANYCTNHPTGREAVAATFPDAFIDFFLPPDRVLRAAQFWIVARRPSNGFLAAGHPSHAALI
jgi:hypothetical protein